MKSSETSSALLREDPRQRREVSCPSPSHSSTKDIGSEFERDRASERQSLRQEEEGAFEGLSMVNTKCVQRCPRIDRQAPAGRGSFSEPKL